MDKVEAGNKNKVEKAKKAIPTTFHISKQADIIVDKNLNAIKKHLKKKFGEDVKAKKKDMLNFMLIKAGLVTPKEYFGEE